MPLLAASTSLTMGARTSWSSSSSGPTSTRTSPSSPTFGPLSRRPRRPAAALPSQPREYSPHGGFEAVARVDDRPGFVAVQRLERIELALEQRERHVVAAATFHPARDELARGNEVGEPDRWVSVPEQVAVGPPQRRTRHDRVGPGRLPLADPGCQGLEPRPSIRVRERPAAGHLLNVGGGVEFVALGASPVQALGQGVHDGRLAAARDSHQHDRRLRHLFSLPQDPAGAPADSQAPLSRPGVRGRDRSDRLALPLPRRREALSVVPRSAVAICLPRNEFVAVNEHLAEAGYEAIAVDTAEDLERLLSSRDDVHVAILDGEKDFDRTLEMYAHLHENGRNIPVLMLMPPRTLGRMGLTGSSYVKDEYFTRPYSAESLRWRIEAMLIRVENVPDEADEDAGLILTPEVAGRDGPIAGVAPHSGHMIIV